ncbi:MAG: hypothetical protein DHS20C14_10280 [Phycisphaeraceae bacterium]|nr:MAG: hypothetical protein DHS20C14_10280 [Phycisphaeraceae bacterium]
MALLAGGASAQPFIEIRVEVIFSPGGSASPSFSGGSYIFDAGAAPVFANASRVQFEPVAAAEFRYPADNPMPLEPDPVDPDDLQHNRFTYTGTFDTWDVAGLLVFAPPAGVFSVSMTSLPDDPADYKSVGPNARVNAGFGLVSWDKTDGYEDGFLSYTVRVVDDPNPCAADMDGNGVLNVDDIEAFVDEFLGGCP